MKNAPRRHRPGYPGRPPAWLWAALAPALVAATLLLRWLAPAAYPAWESETGPVELGTALLLLPAVAFSVAIVRRRAALPARALTAWFALAGAGCLYLAGEELSWGQHLIGWETPEWLATVNDQGETNLHNVSSWLDQKPRTLLELWVLAALAIACAGLRRGKAPDPENPWHWYWPGPHVIPGALLAVLVRLPERVESWTEWIRPVPLNIRLSELQEFCFAVVLLVYVWDVCSRLESRRRAGAIPARPG